jgi:hypothetical protein
VSGGEALVLDEAELTLGDTCIATAAVPHFSLFHPRDTRYRGRTLVFPATDDTLERFALRPIGLATTALEIVAPDSAGINGTFAVTRVTPSADLELLDAEVPAEWPLPSSTTVVEDRRRIRCTTSGAAKLTRSGELVLPTTNRGIGMNLGQTGECLTADLRSVVDVPEAKVLGPANSGRILFSTDEGLRSGEPGGVLILIASGRRVNAAIELAPGAVVYSRYLDDGRSQQELVLIVNGPVMELKSPDGTTLDSSLFGPLTVTAPSEGPYRLQVASPYMAIENFTLDLTANCPTTCGNRRYPTQDFAVLAGQIFMGDTLSVAFEIGGVPCWSTVYIDAFCTGMADAELTVSISDADPGAIVTLTIIDEGDASSMDLDDFSEAVDRRS